MEELINIRLHKGAGNISGDNMTEFHRINSTRQHKRFNSHGGGTGLLFGLVEALFPSVGTATAFYAAKSFFLQKHEVVQGSALLFPG